MILNVILIFILIKLSRCSLVLDSLSQNTLYVSSYCPEMKNCIEGSHVICRYYNHHQTTGAMCNNYVKISITPQMVQQILEGVNKIRMKLATGEETGKDNQPLPRAYGMMKMHWDSELATLAQVLADQCLGLQEDSCRATDKFSNPSQIITLINFKAPHWEYLTGNTTKLGLNKEKVSSSIDKALKSLHGVKRLITTNDINNCPVLEAISDKGSRSYLKLIRGKATHIGCGISAYTRPQILSSGLQHTYNSIQLVCNVSDGPQGSKPVYTTDPPIPETGFTEKCGCPEGYRDSIGCLCERDTHGNIENTEIRHIELDKHDGRGQSQSHEMEPCADPNGICDEEPNMVVLPIFEIQDAPNTSYEPENDIEMEFHQAFGNTSFIQTSVEGNENKIPDDEIYPETANGLLRMHTNDIRNHDYRRAISNEQREKEFVSHDNVGINIETSPENNDNAYSMEKNIVEQSARQNSDYGDKMAANDEHEVQEEENSFLTILDHLEKAVKNIKLEDEEKDIFDIKMRKIYEAALKSANKHESDELEDEFRKLTDYLKHKSDAASADESLHSDKEDEYDYLNRRENDSDEFSNGIDEKLIEILSKKHHHKDDYFSKHGDMDRRRDKNDAYPNFPVTRNQEKISKYDKTIIETKKGKGNLDIRYLKKLRSSDTTSYYGLNNMKHELKKNTLNDMRKMHTNNKAQSIKTFSRRTFLYPKHKVRKTSTSPGYRGIFETENERPTLPTTQNYEKIKVEIHKKKYIKKNRPVL